MKNLLVIALVALVFTGCTKSTTTNTPTHDSNERENPNLALYNEVMDVHDEVMPKMQDLYNLKKSLQEQLAATPNLPAEEKVQLEQRIVVLDSVSNLMMVWMREFNPLPDTVDQELAREYLESEMEKIKQVKEAMLETIEKEKGNN